MATDLQKLNVSLTKHGAHKIATLLQKYNKDEILNHLIHSEPGINIDLPQAKQNLSADRRGLVPDLWNEARIKGSETINALVLSSIILSHHQLVDAIKKSAAKTRFAGTVKRGDVLSGKSFTNFAHTVEELGYSTDHSADHVCYDFHKLFQIPGLNILFEKLLRLKLIAAGWDQSNSIVEESAQLGLHEVFSLSAKEFGTWLVTGSLISEDQAPDEIEDSEFFSEADDDRSAGNFEFKPGHNAKKTGVVVAGAAAEPKTAILLHNEIQNQMYEDLVARYGKACVGTEVATGDGTAIDVIVKTDKFCWFYEIKTGSSVRLCIRQAIPQLLEYAYWQGDCSRADKLIIVSPKKLTPQAAAYLDFLRQQFKLNIHYEQFRIKPGEAEK
ncbi:MAG: hypothetical protein KGK17_03325 [Betaproteobacteria bacterium]|nr:hypothetical protein [Betaproteobacteria bacterium]